MPPKPTGRGNEEGETVSSSDLQKLEVTIKNLLEHMQINSSLNIDKNTQTITDIAKKLDETHTLI